MMNLNYLMDHITYQIFKITLSIFKKHNKKTDNPTRSIYVIQTESKIIFKIKADIILSF